MKLFFVLIVFTCIFISCTTTSSRFPKYPYGLLGDDYGILNEDDLGTYAWIVTEPVPFSQRKSNLAYMYWQCFPIGTIKKMRCRTIDDNDPENIIADAEVWIETETEIHEYEFRRGLERAVCKYHIENWKKLLKGESAFCFGGKPVTSEEVKLNNKTKTKIGWVYDKIKTKKGCYAYFGEDKGDCDVEYWREQGYPGPHPP